MGSMVYEQFRWGTGQFRMIIGYYGNEKRGNQTGRVGGQDLPLGTIEDHFCWGKRRNCDSIVGEQCYSGLLRGRPVGCREIVDGEKI